MEFAIPLEEVLRAEFQRWNAWLQSAEAAIADARAFGHPLLLGEALLTWVKILTARLMNGRWLRQSMGVSLMAPEIPEPLLAVARQTVELYIQAGSLEGELRAKLILTDVPADWKADASFTSTPSVLQDSLAGRTVPAGVFTTDTLVLQRDLVRNCQAAAADASGVRSRPDSFGLGCTG